MKRTTKKLALATQTVQPLTAQQLRSVDGGRKRPPGESQCSYDYSGCINDCTN